MLFRSAKKAKDSVAFASSGNGSAQHLAGALFESATGVEMLHVPYKGGGPALVDVISGQVPVFFGNLASTLAHIQSGKLCALAVTSAKRSPLLPNTPTLLEAVVKGAEIHEWNKVFVPAATSEKVSTCINNDRLKDLHSQNYLIFERSLSTKKYSHLNTFLPPKHAETHPVQVPLPI